MGTGFRKRSCTIKRKGDESLSTSSKSDSRERQMRALTRRDALRAGAALGAFALIQSAGQFSHLLGEQFDLLGLLLHRLAQVAQFLRNCDILRLYARGRRDGNGESQYQRKDAAHKNCFSCSRAAGKHGTAIFCRNSGQLAREPVLLFCRCPSMMGICLTGRNDPSAPLRGARSRVMAAGQSRPTFPSPIPRICSSVCAR